jgi:hypothetical protein
LKKVAATYNSRDVVGLVLQQTRVLKAAFEAARMHENPRALQVQAGLGGWCGLTAWVFFAHLGGGAKRALGIRPQRGRTQLTWKI